MTLKFTFLNSFDKAFTKLSSTQQDKVEKTISQILKIVKKKEQNNSGLRVKKLADYLFEARVDIHLRLIFQIRKEQIIFVLIANHDQVKKYIRKYSGK